MRRWPPRRGDPPPSGTSRRVHTRGAVIQRVFSHDIWRAASSTRRSAGPESTIVDLWTDRRQGRPHDRGPARPDTRPDPGSPAACLGARRRLQAGTDPAPGRRPACRTACLGRAPLDPRPRGQRAIGRLGGSGARAGLGAAVQRLRSPRRGRAVAALGRMPDKRQGSPAPCRSPTISSGSSRAGGCPTRRRATRWAWTRTASLRDDDGAMIRWVSARRPLVWTVPAPEMTPSGRAPRARPALPPRPGPGDGATPSAGLGPDRAGAGESHRRRARRRADAGRDADRRSLDPDDDAASFRASPGAPPPAVRLLQQRHVEYLLQGADRELLVPDAGRRPELWTPRVWPGALLIDGEVRERSAGRTRSSTSTRRDPLLAGRSPASRGGGGEPALPGIQRDIRVRWGG